MRCRSKHNMLSTTLAYDVYVIAIITVYFERNVGPNARAVYVEKFVTYEMDFMCHFITKFVIGATSPIN